MSETIYLLAGDKKGILFDYIEDACEELIRYAAYECQHPSAKNTGWLGLFKIEAYEDSPSLYDMNGRDVEIEWADDNLEYACCLRAIKDEDYDEEHEEDETLMRIEFSRDRYDICRICES